jgi:1,2-beta-oligoglucan phosphorylase
VCARFIPGTSLVRYGNGDWNDSLRPVDPTKRDWMTSAWTVVLLYEQLRRYAEILRQAKRPPKLAKELDALAAAMRRDFNTCLIRDGVVAGYGRKAASPSYCCIQVINKRGSLFRSYR